MARPGIVAAQTRNILDGQNEQLNRLEAKLDEILFILKADSMGGTPVPLLVALSEQESLPDKPARSKKKGTG